jgi:hypothetical protein
MLDLNAPIIPGLSAAGIRVGSEHSELAEAGQSKPERIHGNDVKYRLGAVTLWVNDGLIEQVSVRSPYRGKVNGLIGIGDRIADVQAAFGPVVEDDDDNLVVPALPGWCFETEDWLSGRTPDGNGDAVIAEIFVFASQQ